MTRQNVTDGPREVMTKKCPTCGGDGIVVSEQTAAIDVERRLRGLVTPGSRAKAFKVEVSARIAWLVAGPGGARLREIEDLTRRQFFLVGKEDEHLDHFRVLAQGTLEKVAPESPVAVGQELELKLGEVGLHDAHAGVAKVDGVDVYVANAAKLVGKKVTARITLVSDGVAWAELLAPVQRPPEPLTAEAEAEKPTRARKAARPKAAEAAPAAEELEEPAADDEAPDDDEADAGPSPAKKRTRRGSRGGRNRKKKTAVAAADASDGEGAAAEAAPAPEHAAGENGSGGAPEAPAVGPVIHIPDRSIGEDDGDEPAAAPRKRTRRGTRGGRNRKKKTATAATTAVETETESGDEAAPAPEPERAESNGDGEWGYTPMSEWGLDGE